MILKVPKRLFFVFFSYHMTTSHREGKQLLVLEESLNIQLLLRAGLFLS